MAGNRAAVQVAGGQNLRRTLREAEGGIDSLKDAHARVAAYVARLAMSGAPRRTGALAGTIRGNRAQSRAVVKAGGARAPYPVFVHYGTTNMEANPWITDAAHGSEPRWMAMYREDVQRALDRVEGI